MIKKKYSVIMGDIISSRKADSEIDLYNSFNEVINSFNSNYKELIVSPLTITLGDEFQGLTSSLCNSFIIANMMRINLLKKNIHMRFSIGTISIDSSLVINIKKSWNLGNSGLANIREILNDKKSKNSYRFNLSNDEIAEREIITKLLNTVGYSMTLIEESWTDKQLETVLEYKKKNSSKANLALSLGKSRNSLYKNLKAAQIELYDEQCESIYSVLSVLDFVQEGI